MLTLGLALALVAQDAPAPPVKDPVYYSITLPNLEGTKAESKSESMKIGSFRWGSEGTDGSPAPQGTIIVKVEYPWSSCQVGANYPSLSLAGGGKRYLVQDVTISNCDGTPAQSVTFDYKNVTVSEPQKAAAE